MISIGKRRSSLRDLDHLRIEPGIEMPGYCQCVALRRPNALCPRSSTANCHWPVLAHGHQLGLCWGARPSRLPFSASRPPSSQRDNVTIARRFNAGSSPAAARVPPGRLNGRHIVSAIANDFILKTSVVPAGLEFYFTTNPALKRRAIVIASRCDGQPPFAPFVHPKLPLAARLGLCRGARPSRWPFSASRRCP